MTTTERKAAGQMGGEIDSVAALNAAERLVRLFKGPQPGMATWCMFLATAKADFDKAICCLPDSVEMAAPDLLAACEMAVLKWKIRTDVEFRRYGLPTPASEDEQPDWVRQCIAAITKAKAQ